MFNCCIMCVLGQGVFCRSGHKRASYVGFGFWKYEKIFKNLRNLDFNNNN